MSPLLVGSVLSRESHLLVHKDLAAEGVEAKADSDSNDDSYNAVLVSLGLLDCSSVNVVIPNGTSSGGICLNLRRRCEMVWAK